MDLKSMEEIKITNICGWRQHNLACGYYPCSDGSPCGRCWALTDSNSCTRTKSRDDLIASAEKDKDTAWYEKLIHEKTLEEIKELTQPWRLDGK
jgi:hypothetical protein